VKEASALDLLLDLSVARSVLVRETERRLAGRGIGVSDLALLLELYGARDYRLQRVELAERLGVTTSGVARQLLPLERTGLVGRESDVSDARKALVTLSTAGIRTVEEVLPEAQERAQQVLAKRWSHDELVTLAGLLARIREET
jgi:DNA-binding MarR family transcriptional regulator